MEFLNLIKNNVNWQVVLIIASISLLVIITTTIITKRFKIISILLFILIVLISITISFFCNYQPKGPVIPDEPKQEEVVPDEPIIPEEPEEEPIPDGYSMLTIKLTEYGNIILDNIDFEKYPLSIELTFKGISNFVNFNSLDEVKNGITQLVEVGTYHFDIDSILFDVENNDGSFTVENKEHSFNINCKLRKFSSADILKLTQVNSYMKAHPEKVNITVKEEGYIGYACFYKDDICYWSSELDYLSKTTYLMYGLDRFGSKIDNLNLVVILREEDSDVYYISNSVEFNYDSETSLDDNEFTVYLT